MISPDEAREDDALPPMNANEVKPNPRQDRFHEELSSRDRIRDAVSRFVAVHEQRDEPKAIHAGVVRYAGRDYHVAVTFHPLERECTDPEDENRLLRRALNLVIAEDAPGGYFSHIAQVALDAADEEVKP